MQARVDSHDPPITHSRHPLPTLFFGLPNASRSSCPVAACAFLSALFCFSLLWNFSMSLSRGSPSMSFLKTLLVRHVLTPRLPRFSPRHDGILFAGLLLTIVSA